MHEHMKPNNMMKKMRGRTNGGRSHHKPSSDSNYEGHSDHRNSDHNRGRPNNNNPKGNIHQIFEKYTNLAREALTTGDRVVAEGYYQHAEHYLRLINERNAQERSFNDRQQQRAVATATPPAPEKTESSAPAEEPVVVIEATSEVSVETAAVPPVKKNRNKIQLRRKVEPKPVTEDVPAT